MMKKNDKTFNKPQRAESVKDKPEKTAQKKSHSKPKRKQKDYLKTKKTEVVDYFPRGGSTGREDFTFNTALIDKKAKPEAKFLNKKRKKVEIDANLKATAGTIVNTSEDIGKEDTQTVQMMTDESERSTSRALIPRFKVGDLVLLTISEIRKDYMIANYTRNKKAMIHKNYSGFADKEDFSFENYFKIGQFVCGAVVSPGNDIQLEDGYMNKKILVSIDPKIINTGLYSNKLVMGMDLFGKLVKIGEKYAVDFRFSNMEEDLMRFNTQVSKQKKKQFEIDSDDEEELDDENEDEINDDEEGDENVLENDEIDDEEEINFEKLNKNEGDRKKSKVPKNSGYEVHLIDNEEAPEILRDLIAGSYYFFKLISVVTDSKTGKTILTVSQNYHKYKFPIKSCEFKYLRPGFLFKSNMTRELLNGVEVAYGGNIGSIFSDHLKTNSKKNFLTRIIHVSVNSKSTSLSSKTNIVNLHISDANEKISLVGKIFENAKVENVLFGNSYEVQLTENTNAFLHNGQTDSRDEKKFVQNDTIPKVVVKEYNFFDDKPILTARSDSISREFLNWKNLTVGKFVKGVVKEILSDKIILKLNSFIEGTIPKEHITDFPLSKIPKKFKIGQQLQARIFAYDYSKKNLTLTTKETFMDKNCKLLRNLSELSEGEDLYVVYVGNNLFQHSGHVVGKLLNFKKIETKENFKLGKIYKYKVYKIVQKSNKLFFTNETDVWQPGFGDYENIVRRNPILSTIAALFNEDEMDIDTTTIIKPGDLINFRVISPKKLLKLLIKKGADISVLQENIDVMTKKYLVVKVNDRSLYGFVPVELLSDFFQDKIFQIMSKSSKDACDINLMVLYYNSINKVLFLTGKDSLISKRDNLITTNESNSLIKDHLYYGFVNKPSKIGVIAQFLDSQKHFIRFKDDTQKESNSFQQGHTIVLRYKQEVVNKKKFDLNVYSMYNSNEIKAEGSHYLQNFRRDISYLFSSSEDSTKRNLINLINSEVEGKIGIIKDYGVLVSLNISHSNSNITGFLKNEHMSVDDHQVGDIKRFKIIDIDIVNNIAYLTDNTIRFESHSNITTKEYYEQEKENTADFVLELFHDNYISAYLSINPSIKAIIPCNLYNFNFESSKISDILRIGDVVSTKLVDFDSNLNKIVTEFPTKIVNKIISSHKKSYGDKVKKEIVPGNLIKGRINGIKGGYIYVYIDKKTLGRIHLNNFKGDIETIKEHLKQIENSVNNTNNNTENTINTVTTNYPEELKILCRILHVEIKEGKENVRICDLTNAFESSEEEKINRVDKELTAELDFSGEKENVGIISKIDLLNKYPIKIDHCSRSYRNVKVQIHYSYIPSENLQNVRSYYTVGEKIIFYTKNSEDKDEENAYVHSLIPFSKIPATINFESDRLYPVRILKAITGRGLVTDISMFNTHTEGFVDICEISDDLHPNPLNFFKPGTITLGRILKYDQKAKKYFLSLRNSITNDETFDVLKNGSTLKYNKHFDNFVTIGDYRNKIYKYGVNQVIESNTVAVGYITSSSEKGVFIKLASNVIVRAALRELTDEKTTKPFLLLKPDSLVLCRVISIYRPNSKDGNKNQPDPNAAMNINVSLRESVVKYNLTLRQKDLVLNNFYECTIMNISEDDSKVEVCIVGSTFTGLIKKKMLREKSLNEFKTALNNKSPIVLQLVKLDKNIHPPKLRFSNLNIDSDSFDKNLVINALSKELEEKNRIHCELYENVKIINEKQKEDEIAQELRQIEKNVDKIDYESLIHKNFNEKEEDDNVNDESEEDLDLEAEEENEQEEGLDDEMLIDHEAKLQFLKGLGIDTNQMNVDDVEADNYNSDNEAHESNEEEEVARSNLKSSKKREKQHIKEELKIRKAEEDITENKLDDPESVEFYEKKILSDSNNSIFWIQYASYILDKLNLNAARKIFERAIKTINISLVKEKLNVWIAYMNLENTYGTQESFKDVVERAIEVNEKKIVYKHLISIYRLSNKHDLAHEVYKLLLKNYFSDLSIWKNYLEFLFEIENILNSTEIDSKLKEKIHKNYVEPKEGLKKALQTLNKSKNLETLMTFGQLQYKYEHIEEARNTFESILKNYQKRSDIWMVYVDKEIKHTKNLEKIRNIFERMLNVDFKLKALKNIIKKYMEFEKDFGTAKSLENVKNLTQKIIMEKMKAYAENEDNEMDVDAEEEM